MMKKMVRKAIKNLRIITGQELQEIDCILKSPSLKKKHKTVLSFQQTIWNGGTKRDLTEHNKPNQTSGVLTNVIGIMTGRECYGQMRSKLAIHTIDMQQKDNAHKRHLTPHTCQIWRWVIDVFWFYGKCGCLCKEADTWSWVDYPARQWFQIHIKIHKEMMKWKQHPFSSCMQLCSFSKRCIKKISKK